MLRCVARRLPWSSRTNSIYTRSQGAVIGSSAALPLLPIHGFRRTISTPALSKLPRTWFARGTFYTIATLLVGHVFTAYFFSSDITYGISMMPTLNSFGDCVLISKYYRRGRGVKVGDIISFKHPVREGEYAIKRVIGVEGDFVLYNTPEKSDAMIQVPQGHFWVVGDNMKHSRDSRVFGPLPMALVHGKVLARWSGGLLSNFTWMQHGLQTAIENNVD